MIGDHKRLTLAVIQEAGQYVIQCLEFDIVAQGTTLDQAVERWGSTFADECDIARGNGKDRLDIAPPPLNYKALECTCDARAVSECPTHGSKG